jgi:hypothetical protein
VQIIIRCSLLATEVISVTIPLADAASSPLVGSSNNRTMGCFTKTIAKESRRCCPPLRSEDLLSAQLYFGFRSHHIMQLRRIHKCLATRKISPILVILYDDETKMFQGPLGHFAIVETKQSSGPTVKGIYSVNVFIIVDFLLCEENNIGATIGRNPTQCHQIS